MAPAQSDAPDTSPRLGPTLTGLLMGLLVAMLSSSIVSTSLPRIVSDLGGTQASLTWIVTASLLAITITTPLWGKLSDMLGRRELIAAALVFFILGSAISGLAQTTLVMIVGRAVQGIGTGGLLALVQIVLADLISPRLRGKYMGLFGAVMAAGTIGGPLLGGLITDTVGWRWNFFTAIPVALISLAVILITLKLPRRRVPVVIDYAGALLISSGISALLIWASLVTVNFGWLSTPSATLLGGSVLLLGAAIMVEARAKEPIIPLSLFRNRGFVLTVIASLSVGVATYGTLVFMSQYLQLSRNASTTESGILALPQVLAVTVASTVVGALISKSGNWKPWMVMGASSLTLGVTLLGTIEVNTPIPLLWAYMGFVGLGIGAVMQNLVLMAEANVDPREVGVASAGVAFFRSLGGTIGVTLLSAAVTWRAESVVAANRTQLESAGVNFESIDLTVISNVSTLDQPLRGIIEIAYARGVGDAFLLSAPLALITLVAIILLPSKTLSSKTRGQRISDIEQRNMIKALRHQESTPTKAKVPRRHHYP